MNIIFYRKHIDPDEFDTPFTIEVGEKALLLDEANGRVELMENVDRPIIISGVPSTRYLPLRDDLD